KAANTSTLVSRGCCAYRLAAWATVLSVVRRNGLVANSVSSVDGSVGWSCALRSLACCHRCCKARLSGSTCSAQRRLDNVYSCAQHTRVSGDKAPSLLREFNIWAGVPSKRRPQPPENRVSPQKTRGFPVANCP